MPLIMLLLNPAIASAIEINEDFKPQNEFKLDPWVEIKIGPIDLSINKAVFMLLLRRRLHRLSRCSGSSAPHAGQAQPHPVRRRDGYDLIDKQVTSANINDTKVARRWFGFLLTMFFFVWFSQRRSASCRCRSTPSTRSSSSASTCRPSRSTPPPPTSRCRWRWRL